MDEQRDQEIVEEYIQALQSGEAFDWSRVPDDPELLSVLKMTRTLWTEGRQEANQAWQKDVREKIMDAGHEEETQRSWGFSIWTRYAAVGVFSLVVLVVAVSAWTGRGSRTNIVARQFERLTNSTSQIVSNINSNLNTNSEEDAAVAVVPDTNANTNVNTSTDETSDNLAATGGSGGPDIAATMTLDVSDLDPDNNMEVLLADFSTDLGDIVTDVTDDSLANMTSDVRLADL